MKESSRPPRNSLQGRELTPRQQQVLELIADGYTSPQIATKLKISRHTVDVHRYHLMQRLDVRNVAQLIREAMLYQYVSSPSAAHD